MNMHAMCCGQCGIEFHVPAQWYKEKTEATDQAGRSFYCPNGHPRVFRESKVDRIQRELDRAKQENARLAEQTARWQRELETTQRAARALKGTVTKMKKRVGNGVCTCCNRFFPNLESHMRSKHPTFKAEAAE